VVRPEADGGPNISSGRPFGFREFRLFDSPVGKGTEYELEFEDKDEYDSGTIARSETLFFRSFAI
jgi:hypothetical protein